MSVKTDEPVRSGMSVKTEEPVGAGMAIIPNEVRERLSSPGCLLYKSLCHHGLGNLDEAGNVSALDVVHITVFLSTVFHASLVDVGHDSSEVGVNFLSGPLETDRVLSHLKTGSCNATSV